MKTLKQAFTLIELLVVISIIAILMAIMMPALQRVKTQAQEMGCRANLRPYGVAQTMYLDDYEDRYPSAWTSLVKTEAPVSGYQRYCRWHDPRYPADGPFWTYLKEEKVHLCPTFNVLAKTEGGRHPSHDPANPIDPYYSYSMNAFLGGTSGTTPGGVLKRSAITQKRDGGVLLRRGEHVGATRQLERAQRQRPVRRRPRLVRHVPRRQARRLERRHDQPRVCGRPRRVDPLRPAIDARTTRRTYPRLNTAGSRNSPGPSRRRRDRGLRGRHGNSLGGAGR